MSGVFGLAGLQTEEETLRTLNRMAVVMSHYDWYQRNEWLGEFQGQLAGLGSLSIGVINPGDQPVTSASGEIRLFMVGEFAEWAGRPGNPPLREPGEKDSAYALRLYESCGRDFARFLAGSFIIAIADFRLGKLLLTNDRYGLYPAYYSHQPGLFAFAPEVKGVLEMPGVPRGLNRTALAQFLRFQHLLGAHTFFEEIWALPDASVLEYDLKSGEMEILRYWFYDQLAPRNREISRQQAAEEAARLFIQAVSRRFDERTGIYLSGGLDSRCLLAATPRSGYRPPTLTFGGKDSWDAHYARQIAARAGTSNIFIELDNGAWVIDSTPLHLELTEGFHSWIHQHGITTLGLARQHFRINLTGFAGDHIMGGEGTDPALNKAPDDLAFISKLYTGMNTFYTWPSLTEAGEALVYTPELRKDMLGRAFDSLRQEVQPYLGLDPELRGEWFGLANTDLNHFFHHITFTRSHLDVRAPFLDYDLVDFLWSIPVSFREKRELQISVLNRLDASLAWIPIDSNELFPVERTVAGRLANTWQKTKKRINKHLLPIFPERSLLHTDYENWLHTDLRSWAEEILLSPRTFERGIFSPEYLVSLWRRHQSGTETWLIGKIAPIITIELMLRRFFDEA